MSRSPLSKTPKQVFFNPINIFDIFYHTLLLFYNLLFSFNVKCFLSGESEYVDIGLTLLKLNTDGKYALVPGCSTGLSLQREVVCCCSNLKAGRYVVVPISSGCKARHSERKRKLQNKNGNNNTPKTKIKKEQKEQTREIRLTKIREQDDSNDGNDGNDANDDQEQDEDLNSNGKYVSPHALTSDGVKAFTHVFER